MATRKQSAVQEVPPVEEPPPYLLEPMDENLHMRLNVWGNSTLLLINQIKERYPEWARMIDEMRQSIGYVIQSASE